MATAKKLPSGTWRVREYIGPEEGYKSFTGATKVEAELKGLEYKKKHKFHSTLDMTLGEAMTRYIQSKDNVLSPATIAGYKRIRRNNLRQLMDRKLSSLTQEDIQLAFNEEAKVHSAKTLRNVHGLVSAVFKMFNGTSHLPTSLPKQPKSDIYVPDQNEVAEMFKLIRQYRNGKLIKPFLLATQCGLRASEICALTEKNVKDTHIVVENAMVEGVLKAPKSYAGYRKVPIPKKLADFLRTDVKDGRICKMRSNNLSAEWYKFKVRYDLNPHLNFHALRHPYVKYTTKIFLKKSKNFLSGLKRCA